MNRTGETSSRFLDRQSASARISTLAERLVYAMILVSPLVVYRIDVMGVNISLQRVFIILAIVALGLRGVLLRDLTLPRSRALWFPVGAFILFTAYVAMQLFYTQQPAYAYSFVANLIGGIVIMITMSIVLVTPAKLKFGLRAFGFSAVIPVIVGIYQSLGKTLGYSPTLPLKGILSVDDLFLGNFQAFFDGQTVSRIPATLAAPAFYGEFLVFVLILLLVMIVCRRFTAFRALAVGIAFALIPFSILATISRSAWILTILGVAAILFHLRGDLAAFLRTQTFRWFLPVIVATFFALVWITGFPLTTVIGASVESVSRISIMDQAQARENQLPSPTENSTTRSTESHWELRKKAVNVFREQPVFGVGLGNLGVLTGQEEGTSSAQTYGFTILAEGGIVGLSMLLLFMGSLLLPVRRAFVSQKSNQDWRPYLLWLYVSLSLLVFNNLLLYDTLFRDTSWILVGFGIATAGNFTRIEYKP